MIASTYKPAPLMGPRDARAAADMPTCQNQEHCIFHMLIARCRVRGR
jgi:hypothetical protein